MCDRLLAESGSDYFVGQQLTWVDLSIYALFSGLCPWASLDMGQFPKLKAHKERIDAVPAIAAWRNAHPDVAFVPKKPPAG